MSFLRSLFGLGDKKVRQRSTTDHKSGKTKTRRQTIIKSGSGDNRSIRCKSESWEEGVFGRKNHKVHSDKTHSGSGGHGRRKGGGRHKRR